MIISRNWLNEFIDIKNISTDELVNTLNSIGLEVDAVHKISVPSKVVVAKVLSKEKHPDADKLNVCQVDVGSEILQIVCGAKNVNANQFVAVSLIGAKIGEITIKKAKLRGVESNGMICSSSELGLAKTNDGIMVLDDSIGELVLGKELCEYEIFNDELIEIELTANRGDCLSINGIARDLSAFYDINIKEKTSFKDIENAEGIRRILNIHFAEDVQSSFNCKAINVQNNQATPLKIQLRLASIDELKNNMVENALAYSTQAYGVLFNAIDFDKLSKQDEQLNLSVKSKANQESAMYCDNKELLVAGIWQNDEYKCDEESKNILIVANYTNPQIITNSHKNYKNSEIYRSFRGSEPDVALGIEYLFNLLQKQDEIKIFGSSCQNAISNEKNTVTFSIAELNSKIGQDVEKNQVVKILKRLGFELNIANDYIYVKVPFYRHDISNSADICEEIVRMIGIDNIQANALVLSEQNRTNSTYLNYKKALKLRTKAALNSYYESPGYIFDNKEFLEKLGFEYIENEIVNPITSEMNTLRSSILSTLLKQAMFNHANSIRSIKLFELGSVFDKLGNESKKLALLASGNCENANLKNHAKAKEVNFYDFLQDIKNILNNFELKNSDNALFSEFERASIYQNDKKIGEVGRLDLSLQDELDLPKTYLCELDFDLINDEFIIAKNYSKFQGTSRDLSILVPKNYDYFQIKRAINDLKIASLKEFKIIDLYSDNSMQDKESLSINFTFVDNEKVLKNDDVNEEMQTIINKLAELGLQLR